METETIIISGCLDCPACDMNDTCAGYSCKFLKYPNNQIKEKKNSFGPITPEWCPIKKSGSLTLVFQDEGKK